MSVMHRDGVGGTRARSGNGEKQTLLHRFYIVHTRDHAYERVLGPWDSPRGIYGDTMGSAVDSFRSLLRNTLDAVQTPVTPLIYRVLGERVEFDQQGTTVHVWPATRHCV